MRKKKFNKIDSMRIEALFGWIIGIFGIIMAILNSIGFLVNETASYLSALVYALTVSITIWIIGIVKWKSNRIINFVQWSQIILTCTVGLIAIAAGAGNPANIMGEFVFLTAMVLIILEEKIKKKLGVKFASAILFWTVYKIVINRIWANNLEDNIRFWAYYLLCLGMFILTLFLNYKLTSLYNIYKTSGIRIKDKFDQNSLFTNIGEIGWSFLHDLNLDHCILNQISVMDNLKEMESLLSCKDPSTRQDMDRIKTLIKFSVISLDATRNLLNSANHKKEAIRKIIKSKHSVDATWLNIKETLSSIIVDFLSITNEAAESKISIVSKTEKTVFLYASSFDFTQCMENLIRNSIEAVESNEEGCVIITIEKSNERLCLSIFDTGGGIPFAGKSGIVNLDEFHIGKSTKKNGTGWGLYTVIQTVKKIGGEIEISTIVNSSTTVCLLFPGHLYKEE